MSQLYEVLTQNTINTLIYKMVGYIKFNSEIDLLESLSNEYCTLELDLNNNIVSGREVIVENDFTVDLGEEIFNGLNYYLIIQYYVLNPDYDDRYNDILETREIKLSNGANTISFEEYPVYLQPTAVLEVRE